MKLIELRKTLRMLRRRIRLTREPSMCYRVALEESSRSLASMRMVFGTQTPLLTNVARLFTKWVCSNTVPSNSHKPTLLY